MHISKIAAHNFKGREICQELQPLTQITGPNFSGKTAHSDAIRLALIGHIPEIGKKNEATFELSSGTRMEVSAFMSDATVVSRVFWRDGESIRQSGPEKSLCPALMDCGEYFDLPTGGQGQLDYIAARMELPSGSRASDILADLLGKLKDFPKDVADDVENECGMPFPNYTVSEAITKLIEKGGVLSKLYTRWNTKAKDTIGHVRTLALLKSREEECSADTLETLGAVFTELNAKLEKAQHRQGELGEQAMAANRQKLRRGELEQIIATAPPVPAPMPEAPRLGEDAIKVTEKEIELLDAQLAQLPAITPGLFEKNNAALRKLSVLVERRDTLDQRMAKLESEINAVGAATRCPTCQSKPKDLKKRLTASLVKDLEATIVENKTAEKALLDHKEEVGRLDLLVSEAMATEKERAELLEEKRLNANMLTTIRQDLADYVNQCQLITQQNENAKAMHEQQIANARHELETMGEATGPIDEQALAGFAQTVDRLKAEVKSVMDQREKAVALQQDLKRAAEAAEEHATAKAYVDAITAASKFLKERQAESIAKLFETLLEKANRYVTGILRAPLAFHDGEVGYFNSGQFVTTRTMSGTEKALTYIAFAAALSEQGQARVLILDELGRLDRKNREKVMMRLKEAVSADWIDQAILIDTDPTIVEGWTQIAL